MGGSSSLSSQAADRIMDMILVERRFHPGDKLPNEMELAAELGISRVTLREAIRMLCARGLVEIKRGRGTYVTAYDLSTINTDLSPFTSTAASHRELLEIRMMLEPSAAYYAAKRATAEELDNIAALCHRIEEQVAAGQNPLKTEQDFHNAIAMASHNRLMTNLMPIIFQSIHTDITLFKESVTYSLRDHREIVDFLASRNAEGARTVMRLHILHIYQYSNLSLD